MKIPPARRAEVQRLIAAVNEQLWIGHFDIWTHTGMAVGPAAPPLMRKSPLAEHTLPIGEMTAAVPQAKASFSFPLAASVRHWSIV